METYAMRKGYTLLELLVTITIISILTGMLLSASAKAKQAAQMAECHNYRRQLTIYYYAAEYDVEPGSLPDQHDIERWNIRHELMLDHKLMQDRCYDCHASTP
tara:strand:- start:2183 stop:2491 length:309 start_codon:yes stop_codon:yes gene_type:complete